MIGFARPGHPDSTSGQEEAVAVGRVSRRRHPTIRGWMRRVRPSDYAPLSDLQLLLPATRQGAPRRGGRRYYGRLTTGQSIMLDY